MKGPVAGGGVLEYVAGLGRHFLGGGVDLCTVGARAKVNQLDLALAVNKNVFHFDVAMRHGR